MEPFVFGGRGTHPLAVHRGAQDPSAIGVYSCSPHAGSEQLWYAASPLKGEVPVSASGDNVPLVRYMHLVAAYTGTLEPSTGAVGLGDPCARTELLQGLDSSGWGCASQWLREAPKGHLPGQWDQGVCALDQCNCSD